MNVCILIAPVTRMWKGEKKKSYIMQPYMIFFSCLTCQVGRRHLEMKREIKVEDMWDVKSSNDLLNFCTFWKLHTKTAFLAVLMWKRGFSFFFYLLKFENSLASMTHLDKRSFCGTFPREFPATFSTSHTLCLPIHTVCEGQIFLKQFLCLLTSLSFKVQIRCVRLWNEQQI